MVLKTFRTLKDEKTLNLPEFYLVWKKAVEKNIIKLEKKIADILTVIRERYGLASSASLEECYNTLVLFRWREYSAYSKKIMVLDVF